MTASQTVFPVLHLTSSWLFWSYSLYEKCILSSAVCHAKVNWKDQVAAVHSAWTLFPRLPMTGSFSSFTLWASAKMSLSSRPSLTLPSKIALSLQLVIAFPYPFPPQNLLHCTDILFIYLFACWTGHVLPPLGQSTRAKQCLAYLQDSMNICSANGWISNQTCTVPSNIQQPMMGLESNRSLNIGCAWNGCGWRGAPSWGGSQEEHRTLISVTVSPLFKSPAPLPSIYGT